MVKASEYFGRIPIWDAEKPQDSFEFFDDLSVLPVTRLERWQDFQQFIENRYDNKIDKDLIFRGQRRYDWKLNSSLGREKNSNFGIDLEEAQLWQFKKAIRYRIQDQSLLKEKLSEGEENELWSIGQHHGLMTPLLDWTYSPYVALFFAFIEEDTIEESLIPNYYRSVYLLDSEYFKNSIKDSEIHIFEPTQDEYGRLVNQDGLFTISPTDIDVESEIFNSMYNDLKREPSLVSAYSMARYACKVYIKNKDREECLQHLDRMTINHKSLFPDLHGSAYFCNNEIASLRYNLKKSLINRGSLMYMLIEENRKYRKYKEYKLYIRIEKILNKILEEKLSEAEKNKIMENDLLVENDSKENPSRTLVLAPQVEILAGEIASQIQKLKKLPIPSHSYENSIKTKIELVLTKFNFKYLEPIQNNKQYVINKIMVIIKEQKIRNNKF